ncbi:MAG: RNA polymerase sigma factor [Bacteroidaceae bacterium]|mgnify:FL=1|nr:RNA polymerase sigma factor [Bacteroidaceae bacterium]
MKGYDEEIIIIELQDASTRSKAFEKVVRHYSQTLYWQIRRMVFFHDDADDVLQNTFIKAWNNIGSFRGDSKLSTWLYKIAFNESLTFLSHKKQETLQEDVFDGLAETLTSDPYFDGDKIQALLQEAVSQLPEKQRIVFNLKYFKEMKYEEMSEILGTSVGALKASYHHAVKKIEEFFNKHE